MAKLLPVKPVESLEKDKVKQLAALIKGCIPDCKLEYFPADPEKACNRLQGFLCLWYQPQATRKQMRGKLSQKPVEGWKAMRQKRL